VRRLGFGLAILVLLAGCAPLQQFGNTIVDERLGDDAALFYCLGEVAAPCIGAYGIGFDPADTVALGVIVDVLGDSLRTDDERCETVGSGLQCALGDRLEPTVISLSGSDVSATATYRRAGSGRVFQAITDAAR
jgi:hypothetical protein